MILTAMIAVCNKITINNTKRKKNVFYNFYDVIGAINAKLVRMK